MGRFFFVFSTSPAELLVASAGSFFGLFRTRIERCRDATRARASVVWQGGGGLRFSSPHLFCVVTGRAADPA